MQLGLYYEEIDHRELSGSTSSMSRLTSTSGISEQPVAVTKPGVKTVRAFDDLQRIKQLHKWCSK
jgi:hypothetical protein